MIDIHCHPLAGVDDGPETVEVSVEMCRMAASDGITHLVATPHCNYEYEFDPEENQKKLAELQSAVGDSPQLLLGCDFHLSYDNLRLLTEDRRKFAINRTSYLLVEFGNQFIPEQIEQALYEIQVAGLTPILTHPERNPVIARKPELLNQWVSRGCLVQVTAQSYTGGFGRGAARLSEMWLDQNLIHFFATDAHDLKFRPPVLSACHKKLAAAKDEALAELLLSKNPQAVIQGVPLPPNPKPRSPGESSRRNRGWLSFFRR